ncbi:alpha-amylase, partial [Cronobacter sakazakii]
MALAQWSAPDLPAFQEKTPGVFISQGPLAKGAHPLRLMMGNACWQPAGPVKLNQMLSLTPCVDPAPEWRRFRDGNYKVQIDTRSGTPTLMLSVEQEAQKAVAEVTRQCPKWDGKPLTVSVKETFPEGSVVRDFYSGNTATVTQGQITLTPAPGSNGLLLLERANAASQAAFNWHNATVYFVL